MKDGGMKRAQVCRSGDDLDGISFIVPTQDIFSVFNKIHSFLYIKKQLYKLYVSNMLFYVFVGCYVLFLQ